MFWKTFVLAFLVAGVFAEEYTLTDERKQQAEQVLRAACTKAGNEDKVDEVITAGHAFATCIQDLVNIKQLKDEIDAAKPKGALDEVFKKYCAKTPQMKTCIHTMLDAVSPCIESSMREKIVDAKNGTDQLIDFVCYKDGDRIALFIAEHGPECFQEKMNAIRECAVHTQQSIPDGETAKKITDAEKCGKFDELTQCIVTALEGCSTPTPGNMAESLFRYVRKSSPCNTALPPPKN